MCGSGFLGAAWSLSTEWQFYLLALLIGGRLGAAPAGCCSWRLRRRRSPGRRWRRSLAVQPRLPAEQGAVLRARHGQRDRGARRRLGPWFLSSGPRCHVGAVRRPRAASTSCCRRWSGQCVWRRNWCPSMWLPATRHPRGGGMGSGRKFARLTLNGRFVSGRDATVAAPGLAGGGVLLHLSRQRTGAEAAGCGAGALVQGRWRLFTALWLPGAVALPILAAWALHEWIEVPACVMAAPWRVAAWRCGRSGQRRMNVQ